MQDKPLEPVPDQNNPLDEVTKACSLTELPKKPLSPMMVVVSKRQAQTNDTEGKPWHLLYVSMHRKNENGTWDFCTAWYKETAKEVKGLLEYLESRPDFTGTLWDWTYNFENEKLPKEEDKKGKKK